MEIDGDIMGFMIKNLTFGMCGICTHAWGFRDFSIKNGHDPMNNGNGFICKMQDAPIDS